MRMLVPFAVTLLALVPGVGRSQGFCPPGGCSLQGRPPLISVQVFTQQRQRFFAPRRPAVNVQFFDQRQQFSPYAVPFGPPSGCNGAFASSGVYSYQSPFFGQGGYAPAIAGNGTYGFQSMYGFPSGNGFGNGR